MYNVFENTYYRYKTMKAIKNYFSTMYRPAYLVLCTSLFLFSIALLSLALTLHRELIAGESDLIYRYPKMIEDVIFPMIILLPVALASDINERKKKS